MSMTFLELFVNLYIGLLGLCCYDVGYTFNIPTLLSFSLFLFNSEIISNIRSISVTFVKQRFNISITDLFQQPIYIYIYGIIVSMYFA